MVLLTQGEPVAMIPSQASSLLLVHKQETFFCIPHLLLVVGSLRFFLTLTRSALTWLLLNVLFL
jgi:hypothetical protein